MSPGEIFDLIIYAEDENGNSKDAVYSYYTPNNLAANPSSIIFVDLDPNKSNSVLRFASVKATDRSYKVQRTSPVLHKSEELESKCKVNYRNSQLYLDLSFSLNLIDSSDGQLVCKI